MANLYGIKAIKECIQILESYVIVPNYYCNDKRKYSLSSTNINDAKQECENNPICKQFEDLCNRGTAFIFCDGSESIIPSECGSILYRKGNTNIFCFEHSRKI